MTNDALRRRSTPHRALGDRCVVARPADGEPLLLDPVSALVWRQLAHWLTRTELDAFVRRTFPEVDDGERRSTLDEIVEMLVTEGLVDQRT